MRLKWNMGYLAFKSYQSNKKQHLGVNMMALPGWKKCEENQTLFVEHEAFGKSCDRYPQRSAQVSQISLFT